MFGVKKCCCVTCATVCDATETTFGYEYEVTLTGISGIGCCTGDNWNGRTWTMAYYDSCRYRGELTFTVNCGPGPFYAHLTTIDGVNVLIFTPQPDTLGGVSDYVKYTAECFNIEGETVFVLDTIRFCTGWPTTVTVAKA